MAALTRKRPASPEAPRPHKHARVSSKGGLSRAPLARPSSTAFKPWPLSQLRAYDFPGEIGWGTLLPQILRSRGWKVAQPFHVDGDCVFIKEFEATIRGKHPKKIFKVAELMQELKHTYKGYQFKYRPLPNHALWMMGFSMYGTPGTAVRYRHDISQTLLKHQGCLPGDGMRYKIACFPGTEVPLYKTNISEGFRGKDCYPQAFQLPQEGPALLKELAARGKSSFWIGKPRNDYGGTGIRVWKGDDAALKKLVRENSAGSQKSIVQRYLAHPLLLGGYKFHMRIHLVITSLSPLEAYVHDDGVCLFATKPYTLANNTLGKDFDPPVHVTNMGLNSKPENKDNFFRQKPVMGKGQQINIRRMEKLLAKDYPKKYDKQALWRSIVHIGAEGARHIANAPSVRKHKKDLVPGRHFELFGMDLMLDKEMKVWMCEINTCPGLSYPDEKVLGEDNPDYDKETSACKRIWHDIFALLGLDSGRKQSEGALSHWYRCNFDS